MALLIPGLCLVLLGGTAALLAPRPATSITTYPATASGLTSVIGSAIGADSLGNTIVGGRSEVQAAYRFRATESSALVSVRVYIQTGSGYSAGTGGRLRISVRRDDPDRGHVPAGEALASTEVAPTFGAGNVYRFPDPPDLVKGRLYHVVFTNVDPSPRVNYVSVNGLFVYGDHRDRQPGFPRLDWANLTRPAGGDWSDERRPGTGTITPIMGLEYANGHTAGLGYMEVWVREAKIISGPQRVREVFTVDGPSLRVSRISVRLKRLEGSGPLVVRLERGDGGTIEEGRIESEAIAIAPESESGGSSWASLGVSDVSLDSGTEYHLVVEADEATTYSVFPIREGEFYRYGQGTYFADGRAEHDDGEGWRRFLGWEGEPSSEADLQFYLDVRSGEGPATAWP